MRVITVFEFAVSDTGWWEVFSKHWTPAIQEFSYNFHFTLRMIMWYQELSEFFFKNLMIKLSLILCHKIHIYVLGGYNK